MNGGGGGGEVLVLLPGESFLPTLPPHSFPSVPVSLLAPRLCPLKGPCLHPSLSPRPRDHQTTVLPPSPHPSFTPGNQKGAPN